MREKRSKEVRIQNPRARVCGSRKERIARLVQNIEAQLDIQKMRITLADFIRLTQLERELEDGEQPREIIVTWKEPPEEHAG